MSSSQPSDLELVTFHYIRNNYEKQFKQTVPMALKYLTLQFSNRIIGCTLLTIKQDIEFFKLLSTRLKSIRRCAFLFRASDNEYSAAKFHDVCDKGGTITIIKSNWGNIFGGYTSKSWTADGQFFKKDENAFLFLIQSNDDTVKDKCPLLLKLNEESVDWAICCNRSSGPSFGGGRDIHITDGCNNDKLEEKVMAYDNNYTEQSFYHNDDISNLNLCGGNMRSSFSFGNAFLFQVIDYEVFQIIQ